MKPFVPTLDPENSKLDVVQMDDRVFALCADKIPLNNSGFIVGDDAVLVVDSLITQKRAIEIQEIISSATNIPIRYLVNTNYHGDHTFGNFWFPRDCKIIAHHYTRQSMCDLDREKSHIKKAMGRAGDDISNIIWRTPDITFDTSLDVDLGNIIVQLKHYGRGNTRGDIIIYIPGSKIAFTGNMVIGSGLIPSVLEGNADSYLSTLVAFKSDIPVNKIISGHGEINDSSQLDRHIDYLFYLNEELSNDISPTAKIHERFINGREYSGNIGMEIHPYHQLIQSIHEGNVKMCLEMRESNRRAMSNE